MVSFELVKEKGKGVSSCHEFGTKKEKMNDNEEFVLTEVLYQFWRLKIVISK